MWIQTRAEWSIKEVASSRNAGFRRSAPLFATATDLVDDPARRGPASETHLFLAVPRPGHKTPGSRSKASIWINDLRIRWGTDQGRRREECGLAPAPRDREPRRPFG
jgi:hypothetical protein